jgi:uncharacterized Zn finger protein (UPF0148 family)
MSNPDIDRRCAECGASVRSGAVFCPQCGGQIAKDEELVEPVVNAAPTNAAEGKPGNSNRGEAVPDLSEVSAINFSALDSGCSSRPVPDSAFNLTRDS